jgi:hypothetical protein
MARAFSKANQPLRAAVCAEAYLTLNPSADAANEQAQKLLQYASEQKRTAANHFQVMFDQAQTISRRHYNGGEIFEEWEVVVAFWETYIKKGDYRLTDGDGMQGHIWKRMGDLYWKFPTAPPAYAVGQVPHDAAETEAFYGRMNRIATDEIPEILGNRAKAYVYASDFSEEFWVFRNLMELRHEARDAILKEMPEDLKRGVEDTKTYSESHPLKKAEAADWLMLIEREDPLMELQPDQGNTPVETAINYARKAGDIGEYLWRLKQLERRATAQ